MSVERSDAREPRISQQIEQAMLDLGLPVNVDDDGDVLRIEGRVDTPEARQAADDVAARLAPGRRLINDLEIEEIWPGSAFESDRAPDSDDPGAAIELEARSDLEPDFMAQRLEASTVDMTDEAGPALDVEGSPADDETNYFPPTDPVVMTNDDGEVEVLGGFSPTSMDGIDDDVLPSALDGQPGDEAIADGVRRALRRDALTTDLAVRVVVRAGVVYLRGAVGSLDDVDSAEDVASRVTGVVEVVEELEVAGF